MRALRSDEPPLKLRGAEPARYIPIAPSKVANGTFRLALALMLSLTGGLHPRQRRSSSVERKMLCPRSATRSR